VGLFGALEDYAVRVGVRFFGDIRPQGINGKDIYSWFNDGPGTSSLDGAGHGWTRISGQYNNASGLVESAMKKAGMAWQSQASDAAQASMSPLAQYAKRAADTSTAVATSMGNQSSSFNEAKHKVQPVDAEPPTQSFLGKFNPFETQYDKDLAKYQGQQQQNQQHLQDYGGNTDTHVSSVPQFAMPNDTQSKVDLTRRQQTPPGPGPGGPFNQHINDPRSGSVNPHTTPGGGPQPGPSYHAPQPLPAPGVEGQFPGAQGTTNTQTSGWESSQLQPPAASVGNQFTESGGSGAGGGQSFGGAFGAAFGGGGYGDGSASGGGGRGGFGSAGSAGAGANAGGRAGAGPGAGAGAMGEGAGGARSGPGGAAGGRGGAGTPGMGAGGKGAKKEEDLEHHTPSYLIDAQGYFDDDTKVVPPVIGES
jgi:PPE family